MFAYVINILNTSIEKLEHNSKEVANNTLYICKGLNYKPEYLNEAIVNGATAYIAEPENVTNPNFPHIVVNDIRKSFSCCFLYVLWFSSWQNKYDWSYWYKRKVNNCLLHKKYFRWLHEKNTIYQILQ